MADPTFTPVAIVGQGCVLPGCFTPSGLWRAVRDRRSLLSPPPPGVWGLHPEDRAAQPFVAGGFVRGFEKRFQPDRHDLGDTDPALLDPVFQWLLQAGLDAWTDSGATVDPAGCPKNRTAVIVANLSYPSRGLTDFASDIWMEGRSDVVAENRFNSGFPAMLLARSLGAEGTRFCLDAACASSLYALKLACDELQLGRADQVVCAAVNAVDNLFLHQGFAALNAISPTGRSRPLVEGADGLVPSEGAAAIVLKRLADVAPGDAVHGVIRGIGLSNDGRRKGLLAPDATGQEEAMRRAYASAGLDPIKDVGLLECHATGTPIGDGVELISSDRVFGPGRSKPLPVGSIKSNAGHLITVAGLAGLLKLIGALKHETLPPTLMDGPPLSALGELRLVPQTESLPWPEHLPPRAALSTFGFGGNNAHLIIDPHDPWASQSSVPTPQRAPAKATEDPIVICSVGANAGPDRGIRAILRRLMRARDTRLGVTETVTTDAKAARTPPSDLQRAEAQQIAVLDVAEEALCRVTPVDADRIGCFVAMSCTPDASRWMLRERLAARFNFGEHQGVDRPALKTAQDAIAPEGNAADVLGAMPNMPANRLTLAHDWRGQGFTIAAEHRSGEAAMRVAITALERDELDMAIVAGADFATDPVHHAALSSLGIDGNLGDGAAALVLKRRSRAEVDGDDILMAVNLPDTCDAAPACGEIAPQVRKTYGAPYAASHLLDLAITASLESRGLQVVGDGVALRIVPRVSEDPDRLPSPDLVRGGAHLAWYAASTQQELIARIVADERGGRGDHRLVLVSPTTAQLNQKITDVQARAAEGEYLKGDGIYWGDRPKAGDTAFVFTGSASAYPQSGRGLFMAFPELGEMLAARSPHIHILAPLLSKPELSPFQDLCCGVLNSQAQALLMREWVGLTPDAAIGLSLGETNALIAFGAWRDAENLLDEIARGEMYERHLGGRFEALPNDWVDGESRQPNWQNWQISAPTALVKGLIEQEGRAEITIIYHDESCLIGGHPAACARVVAQLPMGSAIPTGHDFLIHSTFLGSYCETWRRYHTRATFPVPGIRFYSNGAPSAYQPTTETAADAITRQASRTIDFPATIETAYADGVRTFIEIGPRDLLSTSISRTLHQREHLAVSLDRTDRSDVLQFTHALAALFAGGHAIPIERLSDRLGVIARNAWTQPSQSSTHVTIQAHKPLPVRPERAPFAKRRTPERGHLDPTNEPSVPSYEDVRPVTDYPTAPNQPAQFPEEHVRPDQLGEPSPATAQVGAEVHAQARDTGDTPSIPALKPAAKPPEISNRRPRTHLKPAPTPLPRKSPKGPQFTRSQLEAAATGPISDLFGQLFKPQDGYRRQVRLPAPPLLLVDRITGLDAAPTKEARGTIWTETDISDDAWYLHGEHMRPGPLIEAGQADLSLISFMGADLKNQDQRVYRLLGCEFTFQNGPMPKPGDTLSYQIEITAHAMSGDVRLFFFQYDCYIGDRLLLSVRHGQAGFFTDAELANTKGVLWTPELAPPPTPDPAPFVPRAVSQKRAFARGDLDALRCGDAFACFGPGFEAAAAHSRPPRLPGEQLSLIDEISSFDPTGGPWGRGYLLARQHVATDAWFYPGHFHNDPCMPGTLMVEAALQALEIYAMAVGMTVDRDGFVFEPQAGQGAKFDCRGQVTPDRDHEITYEVFIDEIRDGDTPVISAALLATCDGLKVFHCDRISLSLKRAWPKVRRDAPPKLIGSDQSARGDATSLMACADAAPSEAFGSMYGRFDRESRVPRLPRPPFHMVSEISSVSTPAGQAIRGAEAEADYYIHPDAWYFTDSGHGRMPFAVLSEILLQPCGWLASHCGFATGGDAFFRNLDGDLTVHHVPMPDDGAIKVTTRLDQFSKLGPVTIVRFTVLARLANGTPVATLDTSFGFFGRDAFARQAGVKPDGTFQKLATLAPNSAEQSPLNHPFRAQNRLSMIDHVDHFDPKGGDAGLGLIRGRQAVDPYAWYFQAHFFQDPVQPGSLGFGALLELLAEAAHRKDHAGQSLVLPAHGAHLRWRCRGQVTPERSQVTTMVEVTEEKATPDGIEISGRGTLWCDGMAIYDATGLSVMSG